MHVLAAKVHQPRQHPAQLVKLPQFRRRRRKSNHMPDHNTIPLWFLLRATNRPAFKRTKNPGRCRRGLFSIQNLSVAVLVFFAAAAGTRIIARNLAPGCGIVRVNRRLRILERNRLFFLFRRRPRISADQTFGTFVNCLHTGIAFPQPQVFFAAVLNLRTAGQESNFSRNRSSMSENMLKASFLYSFSGSF